VDRNTKEFQTACGAVAPISLRVEIPGTAAALSRKWDAAFVLIGSDPRCDLCLEHRIVSKFHAYLQIIGGRIFCIDLCSDSGTHWENGSEGSGWLDAENAIGIGPFRIRLAANEQARPGGDSLLSQILNPLQALPRINNSLPYLLFDIERGNQEAVRWRMRQIVVLLGSSPRCNICMGGSNIEPFHCSLVRTPSGTWLVNFGGSTLLNGESVSCARLYHGDRLQIGRFHLRAFYGQPGTNSPLPGAALLATDSPARALEMQPENGAGARNSQRLLAAQSKPPALSGPKAQLEKDSGVQPAQHSLFPQASSLEWQPAVVNDPNLPVSAWMNGVLAKGGADASWEGLPQALLLQLFTQHQLLQQQVAQNQESMTLLCGLLGTLLKDQRGGVREDIEKLQKATHDLKAIQLELANQTAARPSEPAVNASPLPSETPSPPKPSSVRGQKPSAGFAPKQPISNHTAVENPERNHAILIQRMALLQSEQQSTLQKLLKYLHVRRPGSASKV
jgi:predicted component of type VI protein secretion system